MREDDIDPDIDRHVPAEAAELQRVEWDVVAAVALGGLIGAEARYGLGLLAPHTAHQFPWTTVAINVAGCLLIGVLMGVIEGFDRPPRLARPLLGTGVLGGFTTFSTFAVDVDTLLRHGRWGIAIAYLITTVLLCLAAVVIGLRLVPAPEGAP